MVRKNASDARSGARTKTAAAVVADKPKRKMKVTDYRRYRECLRVQNASHLKSPINPTQFRRMVAEVMRENHEGYRISKRALPPLMHIVETDLHRVWTAARYMSNVVGKKKSVGIRAINLAEALLLRPQIMSGGPPLNTGSFDDSTVGVTIDYTLPGQKAKDAAEKKKKKNKKPAVAETAAAEEKKAEEEEEEDEEEEEEEEGQ